MISIIIRIPKKIAEDNKADSEFLVIRDITYGEATHPPSIITRHKVVSKFSHLAGAELEIHLKIYGITKPNPSPKMTHPTTKIPKSREMLEVCKQEPCKKYRLKE